MAGKTLTIDQTGTTQLALEYGSEQIQEYGQKPNGSFSTTPTSTSAWDRVKNVSGFSTVYQPERQLARRRTSASALAPPLTLPKSGVSAGASPPLQYYVRFELYNGTTVTVNGDQLFALKTFSFTDEQTLNIGSSSSGAGAGKVTFDPLQLSFTQLGLDPQLMKMLASGTPFKEVDVLGYDVSPNGSSHLAVDYSFGLVAGKTLTTDQTGITQLDLEYGSQAIQEYDQRTILRSIAGVSGFNGDGRTGILWQNAGTLASWLMNDSTITSINAHAATSHASWNVVDIADFNGDSNSDILWRNNSGAMAEWLMNGTSIMSSVTPNLGGAAVSPDATWSTQAKPTNFG